MQEVALEHALILPFSLSDLHATPWCQWSSPTTWPFRTTRVKTSLGHPAPESRVESSYPSAPAPSARSASCESWPSWTPCGTRPWLAIGLGLWLFSHLPMAQDPGMWHKLG